MPGVRSNDNCCSSALKLSIFSEPLRKIHFQTGLPMVCAIGCASHPLEALGASGGDEGRHHGHPLPILILVATRDSPPKDRGGRPSPACDVAGAWCLVLVLLLMTCCCCCPHCCCIMTMCCNNCSNVAVVWGACTRPADDADRTTQRFASILGANVFCMNQIFRTFRQVCIYS